MNMAHVERNWWLAFLVSCAEAFFQCESKSTVLKIWKFAGRWIFDQVYTRYGKEILKRYETARNFFCFIQVKQKFQNNLKKHALS